MKNKEFYLIVILLISNILPLFSQEAEYRPGLLFREDWKETPPEIPVNQDHVANPNLILHLYGPGKDVIKKSNHEQPADDPFYIWSGLCEGNWLVTLEYSGKTADLSGFSKIRWRSKQAGLRQLRIVLKLTDGTWIVSKDSDAASRDWRIREFNLQDLQWYELDIITISEKLQVYSPDLTGVEEIGFTDLMRGGQSTACSRLDWIEVYGKANTPNNK